MRFYKLFVILPLLTSLAQPQEAIHQASLGGRITDPSGAVVEGVEITARHTATNLTTSTRTDSEGRYRFGYLKIGPYRITAEKSGFAKAANELTLSIGGAYDLPVSLALAGSQTEVTITADLAHLDTARTQIAGTVSQTELQSLPLNGRNFLDLALYVPGVSPTNTASNQLFAETSAVPGQGISIGSQRNFSNSFIVDGLSANDDAAGLSGISYGLDAVQEMQVVTSGGQAELGRALGGYVNVVTKSGTNEVHGNVYSYFRNQRFNAANAISNAKLPITQAQYGAGLGGPIKRDQAFYFGNFEQRILNQSGLVTITPANVDAVNARLRAVNYPGPQIRTGIYSNPVHTTHALAKVDHRLLTVRYSLYDASSQNSRGAGALSAPSASSGLDNLDQALALSNIHSLGSRTVNELRGQYTHLNLKALPTDPLGPAVNISGVAVFGTLSSSPTGRVSDMFEIVDNVSHQSGAHSWKAGVSILHNKTKITFPRSNRGSYAFSSLANFLTGTYNNSGFTQTFGDTVVSQSNPNVGVYAQDEWKAAPSLTFNAGVRYDAQFLDTIDTIRNLSPRFGFAWSPAATRRTVVRGSFGLFYDRVPLRALANALLSASNTTDLAQIRQRNVSLSPTQTSAPVFPNIIPTAIASTALLNLTTMDPKLKSANSQQISFEVERQLTSSAIFSAGYQRVHGLRLIAAINQNVPTCAASGNNNGCRPNSAYANNSRYSAAADSHYDGLHLSFVQRPTKWGSYRVSYTYSKANNNVGEFFFSSPINPYNIWDDYGRSDDDQRHRVVVNGSTQSHGFQFSSSLQYYSALPFNILSGTTTIQGTNGRPIVNGAFIPRNSGSGFDYLNLTARLSRTFRITEGLRMEALAEGFNLLNHMNGVARNNTSTSASFGQVTAVSESRSMQFGLRLSF
jgi:hypothetical protein